MTRILDQLDAAKLGERLRIARNSAGLTQEQAASALGLSRTTMVAMERGERQVRPEELLALAELYKTSLHGLVRPTSLHVDLVGQFRRGRRGNVDDPEGLAAMRLLHGLATACAELEVALENPLKTDYPNERPMGRGRLDTQAEDLAIAIRNRLGLGMSPIPDLVTVLELEIGLRIFIRPLASTISGVYAYHDSLGGCVLINAKHPRTRQNWTLAHEFGHFLTSRHAPAIMYTDESRGHLAEDVADLFASSLMMPSALVRRIYDEYVGAHGRFSLRHLILSAHRLHVSIEAMSRRMEQLELLPRGTYESQRERGLNADVVRQVLGPDPAESASSPPPRLLVLAAEAYYKDLLTEGQLADMLVMDRFEVRRLLDALDDATLSGGS